MKRQPKQSGFTLVELLVVMVIILLISAVALPAILWGLQGRQLSEIARILQAAIVGAKDAAIAVNQPRGIRFLTDPSVPIARLANGQIDPTRALVCNRWVPIEFGPDYSDGKLSMGASAGLVPPYPCLVVEESPFDPYDLANAPNSPTNWFWNIRVGDKLRVGKSGPEYTVVGPLVMSAADGNTELFVNVGPPGTPSILSKTDISGKVYPAEFLYLVNGVDDDKDGFTDEGRDGLDNDLVNGIDDLAEWEQETWLVNLPVTPFNLDYSITRRPVPSPGGRAVQLPSSVVIDLTTWGLTADQTPDGMDHRVRSRLPINPWTGELDLMINPDGMVIPTTIYSSPSSVGMDGAFYHFWLAERSDVFDDPSMSTKDAYLVTLFSRTGKLSTRPVENGTSPYTAAQKGE